MKIELGEHYKKKSLELKNKLYAINKEIKSIVKSEIESNAINELKGKKVVINNRKQDPFFFDHIEPTPHKVVLVYGYAAKKDGTQSKSIRTYIANEGDDINEFVEPENEVKNS